MGQDDLSLHKFHKSNSDILKALSMKIFDALEYLLRKKETR